MPHPPASEDKLAIMAEPLDDIYKWLKPRPCISVRLHGTQRRDKLAMPPSRQHSYCIAAARAPYSHKVNMEEKTNPGELLRDTLDMLILKTLARGAMHGYAIAEFIEQRSEEVLRVEEGALYPALHRLEIRGLLASKWGVSENNRRAKYYRLTAAGRKQLVEETERWGRMATAIARILETA